MRSRAKSAGVAGAGSKVSQEVRSRSKAYLDGQKVRSRSKAYQDGLELRSRNRPYLEGRKVRSKSKPKVASDRAGLREERFETVPSGLLPAVLIKDVSYKDFHGRLHTQRAGTAVEVWSTEPGAVSMDAQGRMFVDLVGRELIAKAGKINFVVDRTQFRAVC